MEDLWSLQLSVLRVVSRRLRSFTQEVYEEAVPLSMLNHSFPMILYCDLKSGKGLDKK